MQTYLENARLKTGKSPDELRVLAQAKGLVKHGEIMAWLKAEYGLGHGHANAVTHVILHADEPRVSTDDAVAKHFTGAKAAWRTPYDDLLAKLKQFGKDVRVAPTSSYISLLRGDAKFGIVQITGKRMDVGIKLAGAPVEGRYEESGAWNAMVTHRVRIDDPAQIDAELLSWLKQAYDKA